MMQNVPQTGMNQQEQKRRGQSSNRKQAIQNIPPNHQSRQIQNHNMQRGQSGRNNSMVKTNLQIVGGGTSSTKGQNVSSERKKGRQQSMGQKNHNMSLGGDQPSLSTVYNERPMASQSNRFRIAQPPATALDVSGKYWNVISNHINVEKNFVQQKLQSQRFGTIMAGQSSMFGFENPLMINNQPRLPITSQRQPVVGSNFGQATTRTLEPGNLPGLSSIPSEKDMLRLTQTPMMGIGLKNELDQFQRPFNFLANLGGKETSSSRFTTRIDKNLLKNNKTLAHQPITTLNPKDNSQIIVDNTTDFVTFNQSKNVQDLMTIKDKSLRGGLTNENDQTKQGQITIFTDMNVDKHEFDIREKRKAQRATSAIQRPQSTYRSQKSTMGLQQTISKATLQQTRPISGLMPQTHSQKVLPQMIQQNGVPPLNQLNKLQKDFKISNNKRPFSANPKYLQIAGFNRPISAAIKMGKVANAHESIDDEDEDDDEDEEEDEYVDLNIYEVPEEDRFGGNKNKDNIETESFSYRIMNSRPTTAYKKEKNFDLPFPELFDRSE
ncbi:UNKNOWN [Stylonychia lemnae]|uniref:Uncharacterized protein n=1 Tax=Stylonychia lemnae TaxID=5949 RepID=A0A078A6I5_STYLE|nr:UNKNOWN [Stylonychia lemnae]|eukprot:CDW76339.1 UNKNOWN [Stylonychia lemnae]